jgi:formiminotetrahydrofolate cyclodeaminase
MKECRIREARYNRKYWEMDLGVSKPKYLLRINLDNIRDRKAVRALLRLRCENIEENNKYWLEEICKV